MDYKAFVSSFSDSEFVKLSEAIYLRNETMAKEAAQHIVFTEQELKLMQEGDVVKTVKSLHERLGVGLRVGKAAVDMYRRHLIALGLR